MWNFLIVFMLLSPVILAEEQIAYNRVHITVDVSGEIANDRLTVSMISRADEKSSSDAAKAVNRSMQIALNKLKNHPDITARTLNYRTFPLYKEGKITSWRVEQGLRLESSSIAELASVTGELQSTLKVTEMKYRTSPDKRRKKENELIEDAIEAFEERATVVSAGLGKSNFRIIRIQIDAQGGQRYFPRQEVMATRAQLEQSSTAPGVQAGNQVITVTANGEIEVFQP